MCDSRVILCAEVVTDQMVKMHHLSVKATTRPGGLLSLSVSALAI